MSDRLLHAAGVVADECISGSLDLFTTPYMETAIDNCYYSEHQPNNAITDSSNSISMNISGSEDLTDLSESVVQLRCKITKANGDNIDAFAAPAGEPLSGNSVGFIQMPLTSIFSSLVFRLNDQLLSDSFLTYPYLAYFQTILNFSRDAYNYWVSMKIQIPMLPQLMQQLLIVALKSEQVLQPQVTRQLSWVQSFMVCGPKRDTFCPLFLCLLNGSRRQPVLL